MQIIKDLSEMIGEEIADAEKYIRYALKLKTERPELSKKFYTVSLQEMEHMKIWHDAVVEIISAWQKENGDPPMGMQVAYDILHEQHINNAATVKALQALYKDG